MINLFGFRFLKQMMEVSKEFVEKFKEQFSFHTIFFIPSARIDFPCFYVVKHIYLTHPCVYCNLWGYSIRSMNDLSIKIPEGVQSIRYPNSLHASLDKLPSALKELTTGSAFMILNPLAQQCPNLTVIRLNSLFNSPIGPHTFPSSIREIEFGRKFNSPITNAFPPSVVSLQFGKDFNRELDCIPPFLEKLVLQNTYARGVPSLPSTMQHLRLPMRYDEANTLLLPNIHTFKVRARVNEEEKLTVDRKYLGLRGEKKYSFSPSYIPDFPALVHLIIKTNALNWVCFPQTIETLKMTCRCLLCKLPPIPPKVQKLELKVNICEGKHCIREIPPSVTFLSLNRGIFMPDAIGDFKFPSTLKTVCLWEFTFFSITRLPESVTSLLLGCHYNFMRGKLMIGGKIGKALPNLVSLSIGLDLAYQIKKLPASVKSLKIPQAFLHPDFEIPPNIESLSLSGEDSLALVANFGQFNKLRKLKMCDSFNSGVDVGNLSVNLAYIQFGRDFDRPVDRLPQSLRGICFGANFNKTVDCLPSQLAYLFFGDSFNQPIDKIPPSVRRLSLGESFNRLLKEPNSLPQSLQYLFMKNEDYAGRIFAPPNLREVYWGTRVTFVMSERWDFDFNK